VLVVNAISRRYQKALSGAASSVEAFEYINESASQDCVRVWTAEEENAQMARHHDVKAMDIYDIKTKKREPGRSMIPFA
jgi:hypothetical protein